MSIASKTNTMATPELDRLKANYTTTLAGFLAGDVPAMTFVRRIFSVLHVWDDLIDRDKTVTDGEIMTAFMIALIELPNDAFYQKHFSVLQPILINSINNWHAANLMERTGGEKDKSIAFILRGTYIDLLSMSAFLVGGSDLSFRMTLYIRRWAHEEDFPVYLANLSKEIEARTHLETVHMENGNV
jgi:hypothetical protein